MVDLLQTGAGVHGDAIFASTVAGMDVPHGDFRKYILEELGRAKVVLFILSPAFDTSPFCLAEMGAAWALERSTLLYVTPGLRRSDVHGVFEGNYQVEQLSELSSIDKLRDVLEAEGVAMTPTSVARWNDKTRNFSTWVTQEYVDARHSPSPPEEMPGWRDRGHWSAAIVDGTLYTNRSADIDVRQQVTREIEERRIPSTVWSYLTNSGFHNWIQLTHDPGYRYFAESLGFFRDHSSRIAAVIVDSLGAAEIDFISLGPGDGQKDLTLLRALAEFASDKGGLYYYPYDVNPSMISAAMRLIGTERRLKKIKVKAMLANFDSLPQFAPIYHYRDAPNVLSLLGNTLGNFSDERDFLQRVYDGAMSAGDLLLLEVRNREEGPGPDLGRELSKRFNFGALEILGISFDPERMEYRETSNARSTVPGTQTSLARYSKVTVGGREREYVDLAIINRYDVHQLRIVCSEIGYRIIGEPEVSGSVAMLMLGK